MVAFRPNAARGPAAPSYACVDVRGARRIGAFRPIRHADIGTSQAHDAALRGCLLKQQTLTQGEMVFT